MSVIGVDLSREIHYVSEEMGVIKSFEYNVMMDYKCEGRLNIKFPDLRLERLQAQRISVSAAFGDLASAEVDKSWLTALNVSARFFGGVKAENYNATDASSIARLSNLNCSPFRLLVRLANIYISQHLCDRGITRMKSRAFSGVNVENVNNPNRHGACLRAAAIDNRDIVWMPNDMTEARRCIAILCLASAKDYPYEDDMVLRAMWPALNRPLVRYCTSEDYHKHIEQQTFNSAEVGLVVRLLCSRFGWEDLWIEALRLVGFYATRSERFKLGLSQDEIEQPMPVSDLRCMAIGPMICA